MVSGPENLMGFHVPTAWWRTAAKALIVAAAVVVAYMVFERYLRAALTVLLLAGMLTYLLQPIVDGAVKLMVGMNAHSVRVLTVLLIYLLLVLIAAGFGTAAVHKINEQKAALQVTWKYASTHLPEKVKNLQHWYEQNVPGNIRAQVNLRLQREMSQVPTHNGTKFYVWLLGFTQMTARVIGMVIELIFVPLIAFYLLTDFARLREQVRYFIPTRHLPTVEIYAAGMDGILRQYIRGQLLLCSIAWFVVTLSLVLLRIPGAIVLGLVAGLSRGIPMIGPVVGGIPLLAAVLWNTASTGAFLWVLIGFVLLHLVESKYLMPRILGDSLGIHPVIIIVSLIVGFAVLGLLGMFLAPPAVAMIRFFVAQHRKAALNEGQEAALTPATAVATSGGVEE